MKKPEGFVLTEEAVYQDFDLEKIFGVDFRDKSELRESIGQSIIDKIIERTKSGYGIGGKQKLQKYDKDYTQSLDFKAAGKSKSEVNMQLTGDMLGTLSVLQSSDNTLRIGWDDDLQIKKAYNHNKGDTVPKRPFFGLSAKEINDLKSEYGRDLKETTKPKRVTLDRGLTVEEKILQLIEERYRDDGD